MTPLSGECDYWQALMSLLCGAHSPLVSHICFVSCYCCLFEYLILALCCYTSCLDRHNISISNFGSPIHLIKHSSQTILPTTQWPNSTVGNRQLSSNPHCPSLFLRGRTILLTSLLCHYVSLNSCHILPFRRGHLFFYSR